MIASIALLASYAEFKAGIAKCTDRSRRSGEKAMGVQRCNYGTALGPLNSFPSHGFLVIDDKALIEVAGAQSATHSAVGVNRHPPWLQQYEITASPSIVQLLSQLEKVGV